MTHSGQPNGSETDSQTLQRYIRSSFVLDESKLTRLTDVVIQQFEEWGDGCAMSFTVRHSDGKTLTLADREAVLTLDNTPANPIRGLEIAVNTVMGREGAPTCQLAFREGKHRHGDLYVAIEGGTASWGRTSFALLEEQLDRTLQRGFVVALLREALGVVLLLMISALLLILPFVMLTNNSSVEGLLSQAETATNDSLRLEFLVAERVAALTNERGPGLRMDWLFRREMLPITIPLAVALTVVTYALATCYPKAVFRWGDMGERYQTLVERRSKVWNTFVGALAVAVLGGLFTEGLFGFLSDLRP